MITLQANDEMVSFNPENTGSTPVFGFSHSVMCKLDKYYALITEATPSNNATVIIEEGIDQNCNMLNFGVINFRDSDGNKQSSLVVSGNTTAIIPLKSDGVPYVIDKTLYTQDSAKDLQKYLYDEFGVATSFFSVKLKEGLIAINAANAIWPGQTIDGKLDYNSSIEIERLADGTYQVAYAVQTHSASQSIIDTANGDATSVQLGNYDESLVNSRINENVEDISDLNDDLDTVNNKINKVIGDSQAIYVSR